MGSINRDVPYGICWNIGLGNENQLMLVVGEGDKKSRENKKDKRKRRNIKAR
jgi:hypothetical protein